MNIPTSRRTTSPPYTSSPPRLAAERWPSDALRADIHATLELALTRFGEDGQKRAKLASAEPGTIAHLRADAIAACLCAGFKGYAGVLRHREKRSTKPDRRSFVG